MPWMTDRPCLIAAAGGGGLAVVTVHVPQARHLGTKKKAAPREAAGSRVSDLMSQNCRYIRGESPASGKS
jgi:hypothetical protein